ncbi:hypothetical protein [Thalassovita taeanensis]|uniref:NADH dehydrogenase subunit E n=1 Tax=Thalassovita taeanensis TaxID=657014 RepID=A0A1H9FNU5_9RHOB|nr:hypothetical protein [Thalassovita taeanensis]SEQ39566.1 hypothetical protein SAMN04488092_106159 [Thalassovita taeanensis]
MAVGVAKRANLREAFGVNLINLTALICAVALLAGCAVPPQGTSAEDLANYEAAVASIGCVMFGESDYLPVEFQTGLTREQVIALTQYELAAGKAEKLPEGGVKLITGACA